MGFPGLLACLLARQTLAEVRLHRYSRVFLLHHHPRAFLPHHHSRAPGYSTSSDLNSWAKSQRTHPGAIYRADGEVLLHHHRRAWSSRLHQGLLREKERGRDWGWEGDEEWRDGGGREAGEIRRKQRPRGERGREKGGWREGTEEVRGEHMPARTSTRTRMERRTPFFPQIDVPRMRVPDDISRSGCFLLLLFLSCSLLLFFSSSRPRFPSFFPDDIE